METVPKEKLHRLKDSIVSPKKIESRTLALLFAALMGFKEDQTKMKLLTGISRKIIKSSQ